MVSSTDLHSTPHTDGIQVVTLGAAALTSLAVLEIHGVVAVVILALQLAEAMVVTPAVCECFRRLSTTQLDSCIIIALPN